MSGERERRIGKFLCDNFLCDSEIHVRLPGEKVTVSLKRNAPRFDEAQRLW